MKIDSQNEGILGWTRSREPLDRSVGWNRAHKHPHRTSVFVRYYVGCDTPTVTEARRDNGPHRHTDVCGPASIAV